MGLVPIDLPTPAQLRGGWAAFAAVCATRGWARHCHADGPVWHFDDGGGNWADLHHYDGGRAVLVGHDHEYSETYFGGAAEYFGQTETDLLDGAPAWWATPLPRYTEQQNWLGFIYGFESGLWQSADYDLDDGFGSVGLPAAMDLDSLHEHLLAYTEDAPARPAPPTRADTVALVDADGAATVALLAPIVGAAGPKWDPAAGVAAARLFRPAGD